MPIPAGILAAQALTGAIGAGQAIGGARKTDFDKRNEERLNELLGLQEGGRLGLTGAERSLQERGLMSPVRQAAAATRRRAEGMMGGAATGADLSRLRQEQTGAIAHAGERAALALDAADARKAAAQKQELAQRDAMAEERRAARQASLMAGIGQAAGVAGQLAGGVPEVLRAAGIGGAAINDKSKLMGKLAETGVTGEAAAVIDKMPAEKVVQALSDAEAFFETGDEKFLTDDALAVLRAQNLLGLPSQRPGGDPNYTSEQAGADIADIEEAALMQYL